MNEDICCGVVYFVVVAVGRFLTLALCFLCWIILGIFIILFTFFHSYLFHQYNRLNSRFFAEEAALVKERERERMEEGREEEIRWEHYYIKMYL